MGKVLILKWFKSHDKRPLKSSHSVSDLPAVEIQDERSVAFILFLCVFPDFSFPDKEKAFTLPSGRRNLALLLSF